LILSSLKLTFRSLSAFREFLLFRLLLLFKLSELVRSLLVRLGAGLPFAGLRLPVRLLSLNVRLSFSRLDRGVFSVTHYCVSSPVRALKNPNRAVGAEIWDGQRLMHSVSKHVRVLTTGRCNNLVQVVTTRSAPCIHINRVQLLGVVTLRQVASVTYRRDLAVTIAVVKVPVTTGLFAGQIHGIARGKDHAERASFRACGNPCISNPAPVAIRIDRSPPERFNELVNIDHQARNEFNRVRGP